MNLALQYMFRLPVLVGADQYRRFTFNNSNGPIVYRPETNGLLVRGHTKYNDCVEVGIPTMANAIAPIRGSWFDPTYGIAAELVAANPGTQGYFLKCLAIDQYDMMYGSIPEYYNVTGVSKNTLFRSDLTFGWRAGPWGTNEHSLRFAEYVCPLAHKLRKHFGVYWGGGNSVAQGNAISNQGPSLYVFDWPDKSLPPGSTFNITKVIQTAKPNEYPGWWPSSLITSCISFDDEFWWIGRKGIGDHWYGAGTNFKLPDGRLVSDPVYSQAKGYHSSGYIPYVWRCSNDSLIAGNPVITELSLESGYGLQLGKGSELYATHDRAGRRVFVLDPRRDQDRPLVLVYSVV